jgi:hypothetical protein
VIKTLKGSVQPLEMVQHGMLAVNIERRPISLSDLSQIGVLTEEPVVAIMEAMHRGAEILNSK